MHHLGYRVAFLVLLIPTQTAGKSTLSGQELSRIEAVLQSLNCRANSEMIEKRGDRYILSDVFCEDGQFYIELSAAFKVAAKRAE